MIKGSLEDEQIPVVAISHNCRVVLVGVGRNLEIWSARSGAYLAAIESVHSGKRISRITIRNKIYVRVTVSILRSCHIVKALAYIPVTV